MIKYETESDGAFLLMRERTFSPGTWDVQDKRDEVSFAYDMDCFTMLKHGSEASMRQYMTLTDEKQTRAQIPLEQRIRVGVVTFRKGFSVDEINKVLTTAGYLDHILRKLEDGDAKRDPGL